MRRWAAIAALIPAWSLAQPAAPCGELVSVATHGGGHTRYSLLLPAAGPAVAASPAPTLALLVGGAGHLKLDERGCPRLLGGNSLVRMRANFQALGLATALVDAPHDHVDEDGLAGFRADPVHADDLGRVITDLRRRVGGPVWLVGTSRGAISAANAASRLAGEAAPDGLVLTSALMVGQAGAKKSWVVQTVFDFPLEAIRQPVLVVGHAEDTCLRSPAALMARIVERTNGAREQVVTVTGGPGPVAPNSLAACEGRSPHGFLDQEAEVAAGIARFARGLAY